MTKAKSIVEFTYMKRKKDKNMEMKLGIYHIEITKSFEMNMKNKVSLLTTDSYEHGLLT